MRRTLRSLFTSIRGRRLARLNRAAVRANRKRTSLRERELAARVEALGQQLAERRTVAATRKAQLAAAQSAIKVQQAELKQLWAVVARDRERVKAESAQQARKVAEATA